MADYEKVASLLQAVLAQVRANPGKFWELVDILRLEPALDSSVAALTNALKERTCGRGQSVTCRQRYHYYIIATDDKAYVKVSYSGTILYRCFMCLL